MPDDKQQSIDTMSTEELRKVLVEFAQEGVTRAPAPVVPGTEKLSKKAQDELAVLLTDHILQKPAGQFTADDRSWLWANIRHYNETER